MNWQSLEPDLQEAAMKLVATGRLRAETDPELFQAGMRGRAALVDFFRSELGWPVEVQELAEQIRLHKRRVDPPGDRGPLLQRSGRAARTPQLASPLVLVVIALVCEQLWRRPRIALRELMQAVAQVCAEDSDSGLLPPFRIVAGDGVRLQEAMDNRRAIVDALKILVAEGTVTVDADLDEVIVDEDTDMVVRASRERLSVKFSSVSPTLLGLDRLPPPDHLAALSTESLLDHEDQPGGGDPTLETRRLAALRRLVDDPATDPHDQPGSNASSAGSIGVTPYLQTMGGRERGLRVLSALGLNATVRRDWWEVTEPLGLGSLLDFPNGRRIERQAALAVLAKLSHRPAPRASVTVEELAELLEELRIDQPRWATGYHGRFKVLARAAAAELTQFALLSPDKSRRGVWHPTPGVHLWRVRIRHQPTASAQPAPFSSPLPTPEPEPELSLDFSEGSVDGPV
ncbi:DUF2398 family protein [Kribbella qitaiheensis]|uniref:DUF2398 family protein n=1 Tax=Kribbella qitaiheensis TaxID=1544730 RepID=A0A7G6WW66_9ACTN|nr:DUF2398 family protein [Kribbella qitaiheensis]QNE18231.1 DUF2398 family protein [Kribbella qitaiheensis]